MSVFTVEALPASFGDALWIEYGEAGSLHRVLIDGGTAGTFKHIESKLTELDAPMELDLVMVSHVDEDHIAGMIKLLGAARDLDLHVDDFWFNGRDHLEGGQVALDKLGSKQGHFLSALISKQMKSWNRAFDGWPVEVPAKGSLPVCKLPGGMKLTLLSPGRTQLEAMIPAWDDELAKDTSGIDWNDVDEVINLLARTRTLKPRDALGSSRSVDSLADKPFEPDAAAANGTSIAVLAEYAGRAVLLGADAYAPVLSASIDRLLHERCIKQLPVDLFKIPHHGSAGNVSVDLLKKLNCKNYLVSTNGARYEHPDREAIARLVRYGGTKPSIHFNYVSEFNEIWMDSDMGAGIDYVAHYPEEGIEGCVIDVASLPVLRPR